LSQWVARVGQGGRLGRINDGQERADARALTWFAEGWVRTRVTVVQAGQEPQNVLGLRDESTGDVVAELDNCGVPLPVSEVGLEVVSDMEAHWPDVPADPRWSALSHEPQQLRHLLLRRLASEAPRPPDAALFHVLDWPRVEELARQLTARLDGTPSDGPLIELRHWYSPAVRGLTAGLEQIDAGQRGDSADVVRQGMERLIAAVRAGDVNRLPGSTRQAIATLLTVVARTEPRYRFAVRSVNRELIGTAGSPSLRTGVLSPALATSAAERDREQETMSVDEPGIRLTVTKSARALLFVVVEVAAGDGPDAFVSIEVELPGRPEESRSYLIALGNDDGRLAGTLRLPLPRLVFEVATDGLPIGAAALRFADPAKLLESLLAGDYRTAQTWLDLAAGLPEGHAVREAVRRFEEET
jgi:hypothetical protein